MKIPRIFAFSVLGLACGLATSHAINTDPQRKQQRVEVVFQNPEKFTDVRDSYDSRDPVKTGYLDQLKEYIVRQAEHLLPPGDRLQVTITDIDMAGDFEPWRGPQWDEVRIIKDIYPPRIDLNFRVTDANGNVIKQGERNLKDLAFQMRITSAFPDDPLRYEKSLLDDWLHDDMPSAKK